MIVLVLILCNLTFTRFVLAMVMVKGFSLVGEQTKNSNCGTKLLIPGKEVGIWTGPETRLAFGCRLCTLSSIMELLNIPFRL